MKTILLPTDFSENSWNAIVYALNFFKNHTCDFYLLHVNRFDNMVLNDSPYTQTKETIEALYNKPAQQQLKKTLERISEEFPSTKTYKFYTLTDYNFLVDSIRNYVEEKNIDWIVMGTKGASGLKKITVGSNTSNIITKVNCTTLVVPENAKYNNIKEVAFPTDFSFNYDLQILKPVSTILEKYNASLRVLHIIKKGLKLNSEQEKNKELLTDYFNNYKCDIHFLTNKKVENAIQCFVESRDINIIAMVAKNLNYFQKILFHTKVEDISYHTDIPFLVVHE